MDVFLGTSLRDCNHRQSDFQLPLSNTCSSAHHLTKARLFNAHKQQRLYLVLLWGRALDRLLKVGFCVEHQDLVLQGFRNSAVFREGRIFDKIQPVQNVEGPLQPSARFLVLNRYIVCFFQVSCIRDSLSSSFHMYTLCNPGIGKLAWKYTLPWRPF